MQEHNLALRAGILGAQVLDKTAIKAHPPLYSVDAICLIERGSGTFQPHDTAWRQHKLAGHERGDDTFVLD